MDGRSPGPFDHTEPPLGRTVDVPAPAPGQVRDPRGWLAGRFELRGELGRGGMGVVYRAWDPTIERELAVKTFLPGTWLSGVLLGRFEREGQLTASLSHPGILRVHAAGAVEGRPWLAYELVEGARTLDEVQRELAPAQRLALLRQVADAVAHAHARGVVHRDLKPQNVLVDREGRARVADFGLAAAEGLDGLTRSGDLVGTPTHMAPEQFEARSGGTGPFTDVWALGVMLYAALTDALPFSGRSLVEQGKLVTSAAPAPPRELRPDVSLRLEALALRALAKDPARRPPHAGAFLVELDAALADDEARARRAPALALGLLGAGALLGLGVAAAVLSLSPTAAPAPDARTPSTSSMARRAASAEARPAQGEPAWYASLPSRSRPALPLPRGVRFGDAEGEYVNEADGSVLVWLPPCRFTVGTDEEGWPDEQPARVVELTTGLFLGKFEVTWAQFRRHRAAVRRPSPEPAFPVTDEHPVHNVTWDEARAYCAWASGRLPTEVEWERAARGPDARPFPWGRLPAQGEEVALANAHGAEDGFDTSAPVGSFPAGATPEGVHDLGGNVWEWVEDAFAPYPRGPQVDPPPVAGPGPARVVRGGGFNFDVRHVSSVNRSQCLPGQPSPGVGFRIARSVR